MRQLLLFLLLPSPLLFAKAIPGQDAATQSHSAESTLSGRWIVNTELYGSPIVFMLKLEQKADKLTGEFGGDKLEGSVDGNSIRFLAKDEQGGSEDAKGTLQNGVITGTVVLSLAN
jgi:hypothetical protein